MTKKNRFFEFLKRVKQRHNKIKFVHFTTHMTGKLLLGLGIGAYFYNKLTPYVLFLVLVGLLLHLPFWHHVYLRADATSD